MDEKKQDSALGATFNINLRRIFPMRMPSIMTLQNTNNCLQKLMGQKPIAKRCSLQSHSTIDRMMVAYMFRHNNAICFIKAGRIRDQITIPAGFP